MMPCTSCFMSSSLPAVLPLVSRKSVTSIGTDSIETASMACSTPLSVTRKSLPVRFATTRLPRLTEAFTATEVVVVRNTRGLSLCDWARPASMNASVPITMNAIRRTVTGAPSPAALESSPAAA